MGFDMGEHNEFYGTNDGTQAGLETWGDLDLQFLFNGSEPDDATRTKMVSFMRTCSLPVLTCAQVGDTKLTEDGVSNIIHVAFFRKTFEVEETQREEIIDRAVGAGLVTRDNLPKMLTNQLAWVVVQLGAEDAMEIGDALARMGRAMLGPVGHE